MQKNQDTFQVYMISLTKDEWKRKRFQKSMDDNQQYFDYKQWEGVMVRENPEILQWAIDEKLGHFSDMKLKGNIGSALAHLTLWDFISKQDDGSDFLILEDNALVTSESVSAVMQMLKYEYDMTYLLALRPSGTRTNVPGLLRAKKKYFYGFKLPNIWLSSYLLRPSGARKLLSYFRKRDFDLSTVIIDQAVSKAILSGSSDDMNVLVVDHKRFFGHVETNGDTRRLENS